MSFETKQRKKGSSFKFKLAHQERTYKGNTVHQFVGTVPYGNKRLGVSISCDDSGEIKTYEHQQGYFNGKTVIYARIFEYSPKK